PRIFSSCERGEAQFETYLTQQPIDPDLNSLFADWSVANLLQDDSVADARYAYDGATFHASATGRATRDAPFLGEVPQFAANYVELPIGGGSVTFNGDASVQLTEAADAGEIWWSNRGDNLDSRLTRSLDLSGLSTAHAEFHVWYDLEDQFDFAYLSVSLDGGRTWQALPANHTQPDGRTGNNYGPGWTGSSGGWLDEQVDLSSFVGSQVLLRFEYVTDQSYNGQGFSFRGFSVPELGSETPNAWIPEGWVLVDGPVPEHWNVRLVRWSTVGTHVDPLDVSGNGTVRFELDPNATREVLVVAPTAPRTLVPADFTISVSE
ncbi:MAG: immune inhibitor A, partial [Chloroflexi bacterium]|nr:immune inhibitor A [Chloroflexota bacterium]